MHRKEGLMFKSMGQTYANMKKLTEEAPKLESDYSRLMTVEKQLELDYENLKEENSELRGINQSLSVDWVKFNDMKVELSRYRGALQKIAEESVHVGYYECQRIAEDALEETK